LPSASTYFDYSTRGWHAKHYKELQTLAEESRAGGEES
jgi:hypothetical protein